MFHDLYSDQIMRDHPSRHWTKKALQSIVQVLTDQQWQMISRNRDDYAMYSKNNCTIEINFTHGIKTNTKRDYYVTDAVISSSDWKTIGLAPEVFGVYHNKFEYVNSKPTKLFNCFINRGCIFRQSWMYQFVRRDLLEHGHVSYWCEDRSGKSTPASYFEQLLVGNEIFQSEHEQLQGKIPYKSFESSLEHAILDSQRTVILETFFDNPVANVFTEKIWRSIQLPRPWLLLNSTGAVARLRDWGFDVFDDYVDHSYDQEPQNFKRQTMILDQLLTPIDYTDSVLEDFERRAQHNQQLLQELQSAWPNKFEQVIDQIQKIN